MLSFLFKTIFPSSLSYSVSIKSNILLRYVKNEFITRGIEEGFRNFLMQHKYPFVVLFITLDSFGLDVNVHPAKAEIRITNGDFLVDILTYSFYIHDNV